MLMPLRLSHVSKAPLLVLDPDIGDEAIPSSDTGKILVPKLLVPHSRKLLILLW